MTTNMLHQALHDLHLSRERGEADYAPALHGYKHLQVFRELVNLGEAKQTTKRPHQAYRITLLGLIVHRRILNDQKVA